MTTSIRQILLPSRMDTPALPGLLADILQARGADLDLVATDVERFGGPALQLLLSAFRTWREDAARLRIITPSPYLMVAFERLGFAALPAEPAEPTS